MASITIVETDNQFTFELTASCHDIGRKGCDIKLSARKTSRRHSRLEILRGEWHVSDLGSSNGTYVNGERVQEQALKDGDVIRIVNAELTFHNETATVPQDADLEDTLEQEPEQQPEPELEDTMEPESEMVLTASGSAIGETQEMGPFLECKKGEFESKRFELKHEQLKHDPFVIGRNRGCSLRIVGDSKISGRHMEIRLDGQALFLADLESSNGTRLNGKKIGFRPLVHGDLIVVGNQEFVFCNPKDADAIQFCLQRSAGPQKGERTQIRGVVYTVGRSISNDYIVSGRGLSAHHCTFQKSADGASYLLKDNQSTHGTFINGKRILQQEVKHGDEIRLGEVEFVYADMGIELGMSEAFSSQAFAELQPQVTGGKKMVLMSVVIAVLLAGAAAAWKLTRPEDVADPADITVVDHDDNQVINLGPDDDSGVDDAPHDIDRVDPAEALEELQDEIDSMIRRGKIAEAYTQLLDVLGSSSDSLQQTYCSSQLSKMETEAGAEMARLKQHVIVNMKTDPVAEDVQLEQQIQTFLGLWQGVLATGSLESSVAEWKRALDGPASSKDEERASDLMNTASRHFATGDTFLATLYLETILHDFPTTQAYVQANQMVRQIKEQQR